MQSFTDKNLKTTAARVNKVFCITEQRFIYFFLLQNRNVPQRIHLQDSVDEMKKFNARRKLKVMRIQSFCTSNLCIQIYCCGKHNSTLPVDQITHSTNRVNPCIMLFTSHAVLKRKRYPAHSFVLKLLRAFPAHNNLKRGYQTNAT